MESNKGFIIRFMTHLQFPQDAINEFLRVHKITGDKYLDAIEKQISLLYERKSMSAITDALNEIADKEGINRYTYIFLYFVYSAKQLEQKYIEKGINLDVFWNSMLDLRCKLYECHKVQGVWGTFVGHWFPRFFYMERFGLGRLQYEPIAYKYDDHSKSGFTVHKGDIVYNIHIPSSGPLTKEERMSSYKKAYNFFYNELNGKPLVVVCNSWLLFPGNVDILPKNSNILSFMSDFNIISSKETESFNDAWRVFGNIFSLPLEKWPQETTLQKSYYKWLSDGNKAGEGFGVILFNGERIL